MDSDSIERVSMDGPPKCVLRNGVLVLSSYLEPRSLLGSFDTNLQVFLVCFVQEAAKAQGHIFSKCRS
jgi:hypothetical protein